MSTSTRPQEHERTRFSAKEALLLYILTLLLLLLGQPLLAGAGLGGIALAQVALIAGPSVLFARLRRIPVRRALGLTLPPARALMGAVLIGASLWLVLAVTVAPLVEKLAPQEELEYLREQLTGGDYPFWVRLGAVALAPAVCEEILFRGAIARALPARFGFWGAIVISGLLFGAFHFLPARMIPTAILGGFLAYASLRSGSILPAMVIHFLNNGIALAAVSTAEEGAPAEAAATPAHFVAAGLALLVTLAGCRLIASARVNPS